MTLTLFERLGGEPAVNVAVERFYERMLADPMLAPFFEDVPMERLKAHQFAFLSQALGGPQRYSGASMSKAHAQLKIQRLHFEAVGAHVAETLKELGVDADGISEVSAAIAPLASQVVNAPEPANV